MKSEIRTLLELLGPGRLIGNARSMSQARQPIRGYVTTVVYWALMKYGLPQALMPGPAVSLKKFCEDNHLDAEIMDLLCQYLVRLGHMRQTGTDCAFTSQGRKFWEDSHGVLNIFSAYQPFFQSLESVLRKEDSLESHQRLDERVALGFRETGAKFTFAALARLLNRYRVTSLIELGCGNIDFSLHLCRELPELRCLGIDFDERFLTEARDTISTSGLSDRVDVLECDLFEIASSSQDFSGYEAVVAIDLFHGYFFEGRDRLLTLLKALRQALAGKRFFVSEMCLADEQRMRKISYPMIEHELFHGLTRQKTFAAGELQGLIQEAGFTLVEEMSARNLAARQFLVFDAS